jgi:hypothetical protein
VEDNFDYSSLPYPMFETTKEEKDILKAILPNFQNLNRYTVGLCGEIAEIRSHSNVVAEIILLRKISSSLPSNPYLEGHLKYVENVNLPHYGHDLVVIREFRHIESKKLRINWINKLLAYQPL